MSRHASFAAAIAAIVAGADTGSSKHRGARVLRFIYRHRGAHRKIIRQLDERQRAHSMKRDRAFRKLQAQPADQKPRFTDPLPWTRRGQRLARKRAKAGAK